MPFNVNSLIKTPCIGVPWRVVTSDKESINSFQVLAHTREEAIKEVRKSNPFVKIMNIAPVGRGLR